MSSKLRTSLLFLSLFSLVASVELPAQANDLPQLPSAVVSLPWRDFKELVQKGLVPPDVVETAPQDWAISRAVYEGRVEGEATLFKARLRVEVLKAKGWVEVPLLPLNVGLRSAKVGGQDAVIALRNGHFVLLTDRKGAVDIDLEFAVSTFESAGQSSLSFELPRSGATEVNLLVPGAAELEVTVAGAPKISQVARGADRQISAILPASGHLSMSWQRKQGNAEPGVQLAPRLYAEAHTLVGLSEGLLVGNTTINYSILHQGVKKLRLEVPSDLTIVDLQGKGLREWNVKEPTKTGDPRLLDVDLSFEAKGAYSLKLSFEKALPEGNQQAEVPHIGVLDVERVKGFVGVDARSNIEIKPGKIEGAQVVDVRELPATILGQTDFPVLLGFRYRKDAWNVPLQISHYQEVDLLVTILDQLAATSVLTPDGRRMTQVTYAMRNNRAQFLRLKLPEGAVPWSTFVGGRAVKPAKGEDGRVLIPLARSTSAGGDLARFAVEMVYVEDGDPPNGAGMGRFQAELPQADVPTTAVAWTVYVPGEAKVKERRMEGTLRPVDAYTPVDAGGVEVAEATRQVQRQAAATFSADASAAGVQPVRVNLPLDGRPLYFEKLLVLDDPLQVGFDWKLKQ
jgi:hypothetical protein